MHKTALVAIPLAAVLAVSLVLIPAAYAANFKAEDFDITNVSGFTMTVDGKAGGTTPKDDPNAVYAYVFVINECEGADVCGYAVTSHQPEDSTEVGNDLRWHAHYVEVTGGCVTTLLEDGNAVIGKDTVSVVGAEGTVNSGLTAILSISDAGVCIESVLDSEAAS